MSAIVIVKLDRQVELNRNALEKMWRNCNECFANTKKLNQLDNEIATLEKKRADLEQKEADRTKKINNIQKSITKNTSVSALSTKSRQIQACQNEIVKFTKNKVDITKSLADKRKQRADEALKLQKKETTERQREYNTQQAIQSKYEQRIDELTAHIHVLANTPTQFGNITEQSKAVIEPEKYDVFISHAWEDKESFVDEFVHELNLLNIKTWYDRQQISWGDSMRAKIDKGLANSKFGIVIISPNYIAEGKYWTKAELDGLFQLESVNGKAILPIWHNITKKEVIEYSPIVAGKLAMTTALMTPQEISDELFKLLSSTNEEETTHG